MLYASTEEWLKCVGRNIRNRREKKHFSRECLAEIMNVSAKSVQRHENGDNLSFDLIPVYANALECSPEELLITSFEDEDPVYRMFVAIKRKPECAQRHILGIVENCMSLAEMNN